MSIIHDALKKVQEGLSTKPNEAPPETTPQPPQNPSGYIYATPASEQEISPSSKPQAPDRKLLIWSQIKSSLALVCATLITVGSCMYLYQQFRSEISTAKRIAQKSFVKLIHKNLPAAHKAAPAKLGSLAQLTIDPSKTVSPSAAHPAPITLEVHGILANEKGSLVLINDQVYQEGDVVQGAKIVKINLNSITIVEHGIPKTIFVKK